MRYLVDGYNVTKQDPATCELDLEAQREALVARLAVRGMDLLGKGEIVVVFDGVAGVGPDSRRGGVEVRYARGESADEVLVRLAGGDSTVVTADGELRRRAAARGAAVLDPDRCFDARTPRRRPRRVDNDSDLPPGANAITRELKGLWLDGEE